MAKTSLFLMILFCLPTYAEAAIQCSRGETVRCGIDALYASKVFRASMKEALGAAYNPEETPKKVRIHDGGWASYKLGQNEIDFAKRNKLPDSYFKKTQWIMLEVSGYADLLKSFQVDLDFQAYTDASTPADYKVATVENVRVTELPPYKVEEEKQRAIAKKMPVNGFVCESESLGMIVRGEPLQNPLSFGQTFDATMAEAKEGKSETDLGPYKLVINEFGIKKPPTLPPAFEQVEVKMVMSVDYKKGNPDRFDMAFVANSPAFSFWRALTGYNNAQKYCNANPGKGPDDAARKEICETEMSESIQIQTHDKKWEKIQCHFYEKSAYARD